MTTPNLQAEAWRASIEARVAALSQEVVSAISANDRYILTRINALERRIDGEAPLDDEADMARLMGEAATYLQLTQIDGTLVRLDAHLTSRTEILQEILRNQAQMRYQLTVILVLIGLGVGLALVVLAFEFVIISGRTGSWWVGG